MSTDPLYDGLPFSYLSGTSPKDTKPPVSPSNETLTAPAEDISASREGGFSYLTGDSPTKITSPVYDNLDGEQSHYSFDRGPEPQRAVNPMYEEAGQHTEMRTFDHDRQQQQQHWPQQQQQQQQQRLPRTHLTDDDLYREKRHNETVMPVREDYRDRRDSLDPAQGYRSQQPKQASTKGLVIILLVTIVLCLAVGFIIGWFVKQLTESSDSSTGAVTMGTDDTVNTMFTSTTTAGVIEDTDTVTQLTTTMSGVDGATTAMSALNETSTT